MIRRHLTPALVAFVVFLPCCLGGPAFADRWWLALALSLVAAAGAAVLLVPPDTGPHVRVPGRAGIILLSVSCGFLLGAVSQARMAGTADRSFLPMPERDVTEIAGTVTQDALLSPEGDTVLRLAIESVSSSRRSLAARARGSLLLFVPGDHRFSIGQRILVRAVPSRLAGFGPEKWAARARITEVSSRGFTAPLWSFRAEARGWVHRAVSRIGYPASALLEALLIGVRQDVPADLHDGFARTGSLHILALSGLHVTVLFGAVTALLWFTGTRWMRFLAASAVLLFYQFLAGFMPSLLRATVMIVLGGFAALLDRDGEPLNILALSGIVLLLIDPFQAFSLSFQLSFFALGGILVIGSLLRRPLAAHLPRVLLLAFAMSAGAQAATLPLVVARFGAWYPSGLLAGLILIPLTTGFLWTGLAWIPVSLIPWPLLHDACARLFAAFYEVIRFSAAEFSRIPGVIFDPSVAPWISGVAAVAAALAATVLPVRRGRIRI